ncbi:helix-turn-helix domain-containing protein [Dictyobacter kobayashii]|uniref:HTH cro/C1-type domain-containing protein n=1 Tax=Dictyobacter kobayashii TaxID=2014872 RepID=A0A402AD39_9CHLR|nr:helix-turn-helix domain-containing protein [Dictyobacter kobayashii]GCE17004.1 hypothetical protein KDK_08040 [Dictyobacter kobayashii]
MGIESLDATHQGQVIAQYRKAKKWSQLDLAEALQIDVRTVQRMEQQSMIKSTERRKLLVGLLGIPAILLDVKNETPQINQAEIALNEDRMAFLEDQMTTRWDMYHTGGTLRAARGLDLWIKEISAFTRSTQGTSWHVRAMTLLTMSYQLQSCLARDMMDYKLAHQAYKNAYQVAREINDPELIGSALARQGVTFIQQDRPEDAIKFLTGALNVINNQGLPNLRGYTLQALSEAYAKAQMPQESWRYIGLAERILERKDQYIEVNGSRFSLSSVTAQKGIDAVLLRDYERAITLIDRGLVTYDPTIIRGRARLLAQKAEAYCGLGLIDICVAHAEESLMLARSVGSNKTITRIKQLYSYLTQSKWRKELSIAHLGAMLSN